MKLIVGLGNPGGKFGYNRHNVGFLFLSFWANKEEIIFSYEKKFEAEIGKGSNFILVKPQTFMNESGRAVQKIVDFYKLGGKDLVLIYDDLDIVFGKFKIDKKGPKIHNGVNSVKNQVGEEFTHIRIGTRGENYEEIKRQDEEMAENYILKDFNKKEREKIKNIFEEVYQSLKNYD